MASHAARAAQVQDFRNRFLNGKLVRVSEIVSWVESLDKKDRATAPRRKPALGDVVNELCFAKKQVLPTWPGGVLEKLALLSGLLARHYAWEPHDATNFLLSGKTPPMARVRVSHAERLGFPRLSRIKLEIDPSVPPREVMDTYRRERTRVIPRRSRAIGWRAAELVLFHIQQRPKQLVWREEMNAWNRKWPRFKFSRESNYEKRVKESVASLLLTDYRAWEPERRHGKKTKRK
ncbi:MAG TPA: hypothetical protein VH639_24380 [Bryobacteraceae bacterium]